jgi:hypothetical protein
LFVEELTKAVLESGDRTAALAASPSPALSIPATLHASLIARLDRLGPVAKEVGQIGAVLGREFGYDLIEPVAQRLTSELRAGLDRLAEAGLLFCRGVAPQSSYLFKHARSRTRPTAPCCAESARNCMAALLWLSNSISPISSRGSPSCSPIISRRPAIPSVPSSNG